MERYLTVTALTKYLKRKIDTDPHLKSVWLKGEISNFNHHSRGHMYFTIKDEHTRIRAVMFAGNNRRLKFQPEDGMHVLIKGDISVFEAYGQYQLYIQEMQPDGIGSLYLAFEQLKEKLNKQGYFNEEMKKTIPIYPKHIGIVTSPTGAAIRDIITTIGRRYPIVKTTVLPVLVQGSQAAESIKQAIEFANKQAQYDVLIVARGGGSIEELWSFNEEAVAKAIFHSKIPVVSAIGHETDTTISDLVADLRAPTPTGAAELVVPSQIELKQKLNTYKRILFRQMQMKMESSMKHLQRMNRSYAFRYPENLIREKELQLDKSSERMETSLVRLVQRKQEALNNSSIRLKQQHPEKQYEQAILELSELMKNYNSSMSQIFEDKVKHWTATMEKLSLLNPLEVMRRGFAIPYTEDGKIVKTGKQICPDDHLNLQLRDSVINCKVLEVKEYNND